MSQLKADERSVAEAMAAIREKGQEPTVERIRAYIGGGSPDVILAKRRLQLEKEMAAKDSPEALAHFRQFYRVAFDAGSASRQQETADLTRQVVQLTDERDASRTRERDNAAEAQASRAREAALQSELNAALKKASDQGEKVDRLREELQAAKDRTHALELEIALLKRPVKAASKSDAASTA